MISSDIEFSVAMVIQFYTRMFFFPHSKHTWKVPNVITQPFALQILPVPAECPLIKVKNAKLIRIIRGENGFFCQLRERLTAFFLGKFY